MEITLRYSYLSHSLCVVVISNLKLDFDIFLTSNAMGAPVTTNDCLQKPARITCLCFFSCLILRFVEVRAIDLIELFHRGELIDEQPRVASFQLLVRTPMYRCSCLRSKRVHAYVNTQLKRRRGCWGLGSRRLLIGRQRQRRRQ